MTSQGLASEDAPKTRPNWSLRLAIRAADAAYRAGQGYLSDAEFDELVAELQKLEPTAPELLTPGGGSKLLSLDKQELGEWLDGLGEAAAGRFSVTPKIDGCAIALQYIEGHLTAAWTRSGADAMHLLRLVGNMPHTLAAPICAQIRGELYGLDGRQSTPAAALRRKVPTDGLVAVVDDGHRRRRLGVTTVAPRYALAMKR